MAYCALPPAMSSEMQYSVALDQQSPMFMHQQGIPQIWTQPASDTPSHQPSPMSPQQPMMLMVPQFGLTPTAQAMSPVSPVTPAGFYPSCVSENPRVYNRSNSGGSAGSSDTAPSYSPEVNQRSSKGPISKLQEFVQSSKAHPLPSSCPVLQWSHENRMAGSSLQFRATTSFLLDGVPHHVLGGWWPSKKQSQRDAAERALAFFVGVCGQEVAKNAENLFSGKESSSQGAATPLTPGSSGKQAEEKDEVKTLERFCGGQLKWGCRWEAQDPDAKETELEALCRATVEFNCLGVPHVFAGKLCSSKAAARADTARRVLWYLHCPGFESAFEADQEQVKSMAQAIPDPAPGAWPPSHQQEAQAVLIGAASPSTIAPSSDNEFDLSPTPSLAGSPGTRTQLEQAELLERKTTVMRLQNRLQKIFAKQLTPGKSVWCWRYEKNEEDGTFQASVQIALLDKTFTGGWASTHQAAQMEACHKLCAFLEKDFKP
eukprot:gb/GFBE01001967.1/.p1 GENE.gb/GFBE01001967.1/~~gb/GFBE01001967.1/.p1  ORF type:complete len:487 (+),score=112.92 gb/GFBE01001967.1/:1-1461(+)